MHTNYDKTCDDTGIITHDFKFNEVADICLRLQAINLLDVIVSHMNVFNSVVTCYMRSSHSCSILCYLWYISLIFLNTYHSAYANGGPHAPPPPPWSSMSSIIFFSGLPSPMNDIRDVARNKLGLTARFGHFLKLPPVENENSNILVCGTPRDLILVSIPIHILRVKEFNENNTKINWLI